MSKVPAQAFITVAFAASLITAKKSQLTCPLDTGKYNPVPPGTPTIVVMPTSFSQSINVVWIVASQETSGRGNGINVRVHMHEVYYST